DGLTLDIEGEAAARAKVYDPDGNMIGTGVLDQNGQGQVVLDKSNGGEFGVSLTDAANNTSPKTPVTVPDTLAPEAPTALEFSDELGRATCREGVATAKVDVPEGKMIGTVGRE